MLDTCILHLSTSVPEKHIRQRVSDREKNVARKAGSCVLGCREGTASEESPRR